MHSKSTNLNFLIDTDSQVSVLLGTSSIKKQNASTSVYTLQAANGFIIKTYGEKTLRSYFGLRKEFKWIFIVADIKIPLLVQTFSLTTN